MNFLEADMHNSLVEILREDLGGAYVDMQEIAGGMDALPERLLRAARRTRSASAPNVFAIDQDPDGRDRPLQDRGRAGSACAATTRSCTVPFSVLRTIEVIQPFSHAKQRAIRQLNYHASTKILFQVRDRFWEEEDGIFGGGDRHRPARSGG